MRRIFLFLLSYVLVSVAYGQSMEYSFHLNSGLFSFAGKSAVKSSFILMNNLPGGSNYTNNPYGKQPTLSFEVAAQGQHITRNRNIMGVQLGYALFRSRVDITMIYADSPNLPLAATGHTILQSRFINVYPYFGHRFSFQPFSIDLTLGPEAGFDLNTREKGEAHTYFNTSVTTDTKRHNPGLDVRLRTALTVYYRNWGLSAGYSYGLHNYTGGMIGANPESYARLIRFGVVYRIQ